MVRESNMWYNVPMADETPMHHDATVPLNDVLQYVDKAVGEKTISVEVARNGIETLRQMYEEKLIGNLLPQNLADDFLHNLHRDQDDADRAEEESRSS